MREINERRATPESPCPKTETLGVAGAQAVEVVGGHPSVHGAGSRVVFEEVALAAADTFPAPPELQERVDSVAVKYDGRLNFLDFFAHEALGPDADSATTAAFVRAFSSDPRVLTWYGSAVALKDPEAHSRYAKLMNDVEAVMDKIASEGSGDYTIFTLRTFIGHMRDQRQECGYTSSDRRRSISLMHAHAHVELIDNKGSGDLAQRHRYRPARTVVPESDAARKPMEVVPDAAAAVPVRPENVSPFDRLLAQYEGDAAFATYAEQVRAVVTEFVKQSIADGQMSLSSEILANRIKARLPADERFEAVFRACAADYFRGSNTDFLHFSNVPKKGLISGVQVPIDQSHMPRDLKRRRRF